MVWQKGESLSAGIETARESFIPYFFPWWLQAKSPDNWKLVLHAGRESIMEKRQNSQQQRLVTLLEPCMILSDGRHWWELLFYPLCCRYSVCIQQCYKGGCDETLYLSYRR